MEKTRHNRIENFYVDFFLVCRRNLLTEKKSYHKKKIIQKTPSTGKNDLNELESITGWVHIHFLNCQISLEGVKSHKPKQVA